MTPPTWATATATVGVAVAACLGLAGCTVSTTGPDAAPADPVADLVAPSQEATDVQPILEPPRDSRPVDGDTFALWAPAQFQQQERPGPQGVPMIVLRGSAQAPGGVVEVVAFSDPDPAAPVAEQMTVLEAELLGIRGATDVRRESVQWPGAADAVLVRWTEPTTTADGPVTQRFAQLAVDWQDGTTATVVAVAPQEEFEPSGVFDILRTFRAADA